DANFVTRLEGEDRLRGVGRTRIGLEFGTDMRGAIDEVGGIGTANDGTGRARDLGRRGRSVGRRRNRIRRRVTATIGEVGRIHPTGTAITESHLSPATRLARNRDLITWLQDADRAIRRRRTGAQIDRAGADMIDDAG